MRDTRHPDVSAPVVAAVERGETARLALAWAADHAVRLGRRIRLVHVAAGTAPGVTADRALAEGTALLDGARARVLDRRPGLVVETALPSGEVVDVLREEARDAAMLVLGSRHLSSAAELLTSGGVAVPLLTHVPCPVAVVREPAHVTATPPLVVVGIDGSATCARATGFAFEEASWWGAALLAVHVTPSAPTPYGSAAAADAMTAARMRLAETLAGWSDRFPDVPVEHEVLVGHPVERLAQAAEHALCLVVGTRGLGGFRGMLLGSVGHGLLHHARCPVVVVPPEAGEADQDSEDAEDAGHRPG